MNQSSDAVPHLTTAPTGPLLLLESHLLSHQSDIESWFRAQWKKSAPPFYTSVDLRNAGFKLAPVDTNLFPAGFNNLNPAFDGLCIQAIQAAMERLYPNATGVLLIPESHTRNLFYLESLVTLQELIRKAGFEVRLGSLMPEMQEPMALTLPSGRTARLEPLHRVGDRVGVGGDFFPCVVLLNNDLSAGRPPVLEGLEQPVIPPLGLGWSTRIKSAHFAHYRNVATEFAELVDIDPWLIDPLFRNCGEINFMKREGEDCVARNADALLKAIRRKYDEYGIEQQPFVVVKAEAGTYGMGIMVLHDPDQVYELNRKQRTSMSKTKEGQAITKVILQEGVYSFETWGASAVAEPVVYMIDRFVVGGFYRVHTGRGPNENLNAPGMHFEPLAFAEVCNNPDANEDPDAGKNRFYAYGVIARLAMLAASREATEHPA